MIFQDPMTSLNPVLRRNQIAEAIKTHNPAVKATRLAAKRTVQLLALVGVPHPEQRFDQYPHEFSGGMRQRGMIAMAIANADRADRRRADDGARRDDPGADHRAAADGAARDACATILITHDLGVVAELADRVAVMYGGRVVELADVHTIFNSPRHPYTVGLMESLARLEGEQEWLAPIPGQPPSLITPPPGCSFHPRCVQSQGRTRCRTEVPELRQIGGGAHSSACHFAEELVAVEVTSARPREAA